MADQTNCPDRTKQYLLALTSKYRNNDIPLLKLTSGQFVEIVPANPFRVLLSIGVLATARVQFYFKTDSGLLVFYAESISFVNVTVTQQLHFNLPTMAWSVIADNPDDLRGMEVVKI